MFSDTAFRATAQTVREQLEIRLSQKQRSDFLTDRAMAFRAMREQIPNDMFWLAQQTRNFSGAFPFSVIQSARRLA
jgi:hypothetical protein